MARSVWRSLVGLALLALLTGSAVAQRPQRLPSSKAARPSRLNKSTPNFSRIAEQLSGKKHRSSGHQMLNSLLDGKRVDTKNASIEQLEQLMRARNAKIRDLVKQLHASNGQGGRANFVTQAKQLQQLLRSPEFRRLRAAMAAKQSARGHRAVPHRSPAAKKGHARAQGKALHRRAQRAAAQRRSAKHRGTAHGRAVASARRAVSQANRNRSLTSARKPSARKSSPKRTANRRTGRSGRRR